MLDGKVMIIRSVVRLINRYYYIRMRYFPPYSHSKKDRNRINNVTKSDLKNSAGVDTSQFAEKDD